MSRSAHSHVRGLKRLLPYHLWQTRGPGAPSCLPAGEGDEEELLFLAQGLRYEIRQLVLWAATEERGKEELCLLLKKLLKHYSIRWSPAYRFAINNFVSRETETYCSFRLETEELIFLWTGSG